MNAPTTPETVAPASSMNILLDLLVASPTNPRKRFDEGKLAELAESIKSQGVLQPLLVREIRKPVGRPSAGWPFPEPAKYTMAEKLYAERIAAKQAEMPKDGDPALTSGVKARLFEIDENKKKQPSGKYEIIAGERRYRAAKLSGLIEVPCLVRNLDDLQVLHAQVIENLQRDDLHPLEEAEGYQRLIELGSKAEDLGKEIGKSRAYIYGRLKLCALVPEARKAFYDGLLDASTALLIARVPVAKLQIEATKKIAVVNSWDGRTMSVRSARDLLLREYMTDLAEARFPIKDAKLLNKVGSCTDCAKRTGNQPELFDDVKSKDICTDTVCFAMKKAAHILNLRTEAERKGQQVITGKEAKKLMPYGWLESGSGLAKLDDSVPGDEEERTWEEVLGKKQLEPAKGAEKPLVQTTLVEHPRTGELVPTINVEQAVKALREMGMEIKPAKPAKPAQVRAQGPSDAEINAQVEQANAYRGQLFDALHGKIEGDLCNAKPHIADGLYRILAEQTLEFIVQDWDDVALLAKRYMPEIDLEDYDDDKVVDDFKAFIKKATVQQHFMIIMDSLMITELTATRWNLQYKPDMMLDIAGEIGIDAAAIEKKAVDQIKAAQKKAELAKIAQKAQQEKDKAAKNSAANPASTPTSAAPAAKKNAPKTKAAQAAKASA